MGVKMKNKIETKLIMLLLTIIIAIGITIPFAKDAKAATLYTWTSGTTTVTLDDAGVLTVKPTSGTGAMADYASVTSTSWYSYKANIKSIVIADGVTKIGNYAFGGNASATYTAVTSLSISNNSVTSIGMYAFSGCNAITSIVIPNSVTSLGAYAFFNCTGATSITLPSNNSFTTIPDCAFQNCSSLTSITIPNNVKTIGNGAFINCTALTNITIPNKVNRIGSNSFAVSSKILPLTVKTDNAYVLKCVDFTSMNRTVTFSTAGNPSAELLYTWTSGTTTITLDSLGLLIVGPTNGISGTMANYTSSSLPFWNSYKNMVKEIRIKEGVTNVGDYAFGSTYSAVAKITLPSTITTIGQYAFSGCNAVQSVILPDSLTTIGNYAFYYCSAITSIVIPNSVTSLGNDAFYNCTGITSITLPSNNSITTIPDYAFQNCSSLTSITIPNNVKTIGNGAFIYCTSLVNIIIPDSVTLLQSNAFYLSTNLNTNVFTDNTVAKNYAWANDRRIATFYKYGQKPDSLLLTVNKTTPISSVIVTIKYPSYAITKQYKIGTDGTWKNYISPITVNVNTTVYARALDYVGNVTDSDSVIITNIVETIITINDYDLNPTNKNITVTATTNFGTLNVTSHTFTQNGSFDFVATDSNNYITIKTVTITNIDKVAPSKPVISVDVNNLTIESGTDNESGVKETHYQLNNGNWKVYSEVVTLEVGNYVINAKTVDNAGNESSVVTYNAIVYDRVKVNEATSAMDRAESSKTQADLDTAKALINELFDCPEKTDLINRAINLQKVIDNNNAIIEATKALVKAESSYNQADLDAAEALINALTNSPEKTDLINRANNVQKVINGNNAVIEATKALDKAERTYAQADLDAAETLIIALPDSTEKTDLINRANNLQKVIDCKAAVSKATSALVNAESTYDQADLDNAISLIDALPDSPEKTDLINRANNLQKLIDGNDAVSEATMALVKAESTYDQADLDKATALINALSDSPEKTDLMNRADNLQKEIDGNNTDSSIKVTVDAGEIFRMQMVNLILNASDLKDIYSMQLEIHYDPEMVELDQTNIKDLAWENNQNIYSAIKIDSKIGLVKIIYSLKGKTPGVSGNIDLIGLPFKALRIGKTTVEISNIKLINSKGKNINASTTSITKELNILSKPLNVTLTGEKGQNDWYISPVTVEISDLDAKDIYYSIDGVKYSYTQPFTISEIGEHNFKVTTDDGNGFIKEKEKVIKIDYNGPTLSVDNQTSEWQNNLKVMPSFDDKGGSGISHAWYQWTDSDEHPTQWEEYSQGKLIQATEGVCYLHTKAIDMAGNESQAVFGPYKIDNTAPVISVDNDKREEWGSTDVSVTPTFADEGGSQLKYVGYQWSLQQSAPSEYTTYTSGSLQQSDDGAWYLYLIAEDWAGNKKIITYGPYNIDKSAPTIEFSGVEDGMNYTDAVTPTISISDTVSGIKVTTIELDGQAYVVSGSSITHDGQAYVVSGSSITLDRQVCVVSGSSITVRGTHTISVFAEDNSKNTIVKSITFKVELKPEAVIAMTPSTNLLDTTPITWSFENSIDHNGGTIISAEWKLDNNPVTTSPNGCVAVGNHTMKLRVKNNENVWSDWVTMTFDVSE